MSQSVRRMLIGAFSCCMVFAFSGAALAQYYTFVDLTSNLTGKKHMDPLLKNPWGLAYGPGAPFWVSDQASGYSTLYDGTGTPQALQVKIPPAMGTGKGTPTGIVYNASSEFQIDAWTSAFIFASLDGTISGWSHFEPNNALVGVAHPGSVYTGLAITKKTSGNFLYAADFANNRIDIYNGNFSLVKSFTDPGNTVGYAPFGIQDIKGRVYVAYAKTAGTSGGFISVFKEDGTYVKRLVRGSPLNQPWGMAVAPSNFGPLSGTLLVSNNTKAGTINGFNMTTGALVGTIKNMAGTPIRINGLWGIEFGGGTAANGKTNQLFFTAGPADTDGFFGAITSH
jgi:uncharacterized protein (TIGR03118 family)